jgi:hypothetical protein
MAILPVSNSESALCLQRADEIQKEHSLVQELVEHLYSLVGKSKLSVLVLQHKTGIIILKLKSQVM